MQRQTTMQKESQVERKWYTVDASKLPLGRLATQVAHILIGKTKPTYTPHLDTGDYVIILNAEQAILTGEKETKKMYYTQVSQQPGGLRTRSAKVMREKYPEEMVEKAVWGMMPKGRLGRQMVKKLFVYSGDQHPHTGQNPVALELK